MDLADALRETIEASPVSQVELARQLRALGWDQVDQPLISKWVTRKREIPLDAVPVIEHVLGVPRGRLLRLARFVAASGSVEDAIESDDQLSPRYRRELVHYYEYVRERSTQDVR